MYKTVQINCFRQVFCATAHPCVSDICAINIRVGIWVRGLHFVPMICGSEGSKSRLAKAAGVEPAGQMRDEKVHAVRCGAKHASKSICTKHTMIGPLLEVAMSKKCTPLWRETSFKNGKLSAELTASHQCALRFFHSTCLKYCACHEKGRPGHTKCCTCHAKSSQQT